MDEAQHHQSAGMVELGDDVLQVRCQLLLHALTDGAQAGPGLADGAAGCFCMRVQTRA